MDLKKLSKEELEQRVSELLAENQALKIKLEQIETDKEIDELLQLYQVPEHCVSETFLRLLRKSTGRAERILQIQDRMDMHAKLKPQVTNAGDEFMAEGEQFGESATKSESVKREVVEAAKRKTIH